MSEISPSERLYRLHELNRREEAAHAAVIAGLAELVAVVLFVGALLVWAMIGSGA